MFGRLHNLNKISVAVMSVVCGEALVASPALALSSNWRQFSGRLRLLSRQVHHYVATAEVAILPNSSASSYDYCANIRKSNSAGT